MNDPAVKFERLDNGDVRVSIGDVSAIVECGHWISDVLCCTAFDERPNDWHQLMAHHMGTRDMLAGDADRLDWMQRMMTPNSDYCEIFFAGLRSGYEDASAFQIESNPERFPTLNAPSVRAAIDAARSKCHEPKLKANVIINCVPREIPCSITYDQLVALAGLTGNPSATYRKARFGRNGIFSPGQTVDAVDGTIFDVIHTGNA